MVPLKNLQIRIEKFLNQDIFRPKSQFVTFLYLYLWSQDSSVLFHIIIPKLTWTNKNDNCDIKTNNTVPIKQLKK